MSQKLNSKKLYLIFANNNGFFFFYFNKKILNSYFYLFKLIKLKEININKGPSPCYYQIRENKEKFQGNKFSKSTRDFTL